MCVHLPEELLIEILNRLSPEILLRCTSVCKSWYALITSPRFINSHLLLANIAEKRIFAWHECVREEKYSIHRDNETFDELSDFDSPFENSRVRVVSSCNGLICVKVVRTVAKLHKSSVYLWNPTIRRIFQVPQNNRWDTIGFGFASETNDYKIINFHRVHSRGASVYELSTGSWKNANNNKDFFLKYDIRVNSPQCFLNDKIHWAGCELINNFPCIVVTFDVKKDEFGVLQVPFRTNKELSFVRATLFQDSLALMQIVRRPNNFCIWVMNQYGVYNSWTKQFTIDMYIATSFKTPLLFRLNGDALLCAKKYSWESPDLVSYDPKSAKVKKLKKSTGGIVYADSFVQTLVLLDKCPNNVL